MPFGKLQAGCHAPFTEEWFPSGHSTIKALLVECCRDGCPSGRFSHLHRGTVELCQSDYRVLCHLPDWSPSPLIAYFDRGRVLVLPNFFHVRMMEATVFLGPFSYVETVRYLSPDLCLDTILSLSSTDNSFNLMALFLLWHALSTVEPYIDRCVHFPNHVQLIEFTTGGLQSICKNI